MKITSFCPKKLWHASSPIGLFSSVTRNYWIVDFAVVHFSYFGVLMAYGGLQDVRCLKYTPLKSDSVSFRSNSNEFMYVSCSFWLRRRNWLLHWSGIVFFHCILWIHAVHIWFLQQTGLLDSLHCAFQRFISFPCFCNWTIHRTFFVEGLI
jgi:hypothetical protein